MNKYGVTISEGPSVIKDVDAKQGIVISYPSTFDFVDSGRERVKRGAFNRTINSWGPSGKKRTKVLFNHEPWSLIGKPVTLREDDTGLYAESQIVRTNLGTDVLMLIENEVITEQSIGYTPVRQEKNEDDGVIDILEVKLYEYSFLAWGMNENTPIVGVKGDSIRERMALDMQRLDKVLKSGEFHTDDVPEMLSRVLKQWQEDLREEKEQATERLTLVVERGSEADIQNAIKELQSLLPGGSPDSTPPTQDSAKSEEDSADDGHSEALKELLAKVSGTNEEFAVQHAAARMLERYQRELGC